MGPQAMIDMADAVHVERVQNDVLLGHGRTGVRFRRRRCAIVIREAKIISNDRAGAKRRIVRS
jgi:hypothetical protein